MTFEMDVAQPPALRIDADDFALFRLAPRFALDAGELDVRWKAMQRQVHPDRFAAEGAAAQRVAMQWALRVNEAYQRLRLPLTRAAYLCELHGQPIRADDNTAMSPAFLVRQMAWREALDTAHTVDAVAMLASEVSALEKHIHHELGVLLDERRDWLGAVEQVRELMFISRLAEVIHQRSDALDQVLSMP